MNFRNYVNKGFIAIRRGLTGLSKVPLADYVVVLCTYWVLVVLWAICINVYSPDSRTFDGYLTLNWMAYPLFWILLFILLHQSWSQFSSAWKEMFLHGRIYSLSGGKESKIPKDDRFSAYSEFEFEIKKHRKPIYFLAFFISLGLLYVDMRNLDKIYNLKDNSQGSYLILKLNKYEIYHSVHGKEYIQASQPMLRNICADLKDSKKNVNNIELYAVDGKIRYYAKYVCGSNEVDVALIPYLGKIPDNVIELDRDWTEAWIWSDPGKKSANGWFVVAAYFQQLILIAIAFAALINMLAHVSYFRWFESLSVCKKREMPWSLKLDACSRLREFGLERWNQALNNIYWIIAPVLAIPMASQLSQPPGTEDPGQTLIKVLVPLLLILPMILTIIFRQKRVMDLWEDVRKDQDHAEEYHKQLLWPLDRNWVSKLGIILAFTMLSVLLGSNISDLSMFIK